jgi:hypothetical protein
MTLGPRLRFLVIGTLHFTLLVSAVASAHAQTAIDSDHDSLSDEVEQALLEQFRPTFMISSKDCATRPARFKPGQEVPESTVKDGTIYGQVSPIPNSDRVEIHYYTLWDQDCGRNGHPLDVEHIAVFVTHGPGVQPTALYWYAGAHENTACNISSGSRAEAVGAEDRGPRVWSSWGKHALYLRKGMCGHGCGADTCDDDVELPHHGPVINIGERGAPMNGAEWIHSPHWALSEKMVTDFPPETISRLDATSGETVLTLGGRSTFRGTIAVSDTVLGSATNSASQTGAALDTANSHTSKGLGTAAKSTGRSLKRAWKSVFGPHEKKP